jgi:uncharacterized protein
MNRQNVRTAAMNKFFILLVIAAFSFLCASCDSGQSPRSDIEKSDTKAIQSQRDVQTSDIKTSKVQEPGYETAIRKGEYVAALQELRPLSAKGDAAAQYALGWMYLQGAGVPQSYTEAEKWWRLAAGQGHVEAQSNLGGMYGIGMGGVRQDYKEAAKWNRKAAEQNFANAQYNLGINLQKGLGVAQDYAEALKWYRKAAEQGHARAKTQIGEMYSKGWGVRQDNKEAFKWYKEGAEQGDPYAQFYLAIAYDNGEIVPRDDKEAIRWFRAAAEKGIANAQIRLGIKYYKGEGVSQDYVQGYKWFYIAAQRGSDDAQEAMNIASKHMTQSQLSEAIRLAGQEKIARKDFTAEENLYGKHLIHDQRVK